MHSPRRPNRQAPFASCALFTEVLQAEKNSQKESKMSAEEALALLHRLLPANIPGPVSTKQLIQTLEAACWKVFIGPNPASPRISYRQILENSQKRLKQEEIATERLEDELQTVIQRTNALPKEIRSIKEEMEDARTAFVISSSAALRCHVMSSDEAQALMKERISALQHRGHLRTWACNELKQSINELQEKEAELSSNILVACDNEIEGSASFQSALNRQDRALVEINSLHSSIIERTSLESLLFKVNEKNKVLTDSIAKLKEHIRAQTVTLFDLRQDISDKQSETADLDIQIAALQAEHERRQSCYTPRPNWRMHQKLCFPQQPSMRRLSQSQSQILDRKRTIFENLWDSLKDINASSDKVQILSEKLLAVRAEYYALEDKISEKKDLNILRSQIAGKEAYLKAIELQIAQKSASL